MRLALLGSVSPVALARHVVEAAESGERSATATGFQIVEILSCLDRARQFPASARFEQDWTQLVDESKHKVAEMLEQLQKNFPDDLSTDFRRYARTVRCHQQTGANVG